MPASSNSETQSNGLRIIAALRQIHLRVPAQQRQSIYDSIQSGSRGDLEYAALVALAALIALFGLLQNSAAVIIGAMLISPMMNPLLAGALALLLGDGQLGKRSAAVLGGSVGASILLTWFVAYLTPLNQATPEILARTTPNLLDLFIAVLSGLAGTLALRGGPSSLMILPGVAIAVAVVPPLAVVGYGLSTRQLGVAGGALLLFLTNLVAIVISAALVFRSMGFRPQRAAEAGRWKLKYRMAISAGVLLVLSIPLFLTLRRAVLQLRMRSEVSRQLDAEFKADGASVSEMSLSLAGPQMHIHATVRAAKYLDPPQIAAVEKSLQERFGSGAHLEVDQILMAVGGVRTQPPALTQNAVSGGVVRPVEEKPVFDFRSSDASLVEHVQDQLDQLLAGSPIQSTAPPQVELSTGPGVVVSASLASPEPVASQTVALLASQLSSKLSVPVQLTGRFELNGSAYHLAFAAAATAGTLRAADRRSLDQMAQAVRSTPALHLQVTYVLSPNAPAGEMPLALRQLKAIFARAGLQSSQWSIQEAPPAGTQASPTASSPPSPVPPAGKTQQSSGPSPTGQVRYDCQVIQNF
jgi:uncharacterized hydrophobic protein (TIGR00271 family)